MPVEVLKAQCGFISQCGLRREQFQGNNMAPNYHKYIPKSFHSIKMVFADTIILALENKFMSFQRRQKDIRKEHVHIYVQVTQPGHLLSSQNFFNSFFQNKVAPSWQRFATNSNDGSIFFKADLQHIIQEFTYFSK